MKRAGALPFLALLALAAVPSGPLHAQAEADVAQVSAQELEAYARAYIEISRERDLIQARLAEIRNKTAEAQQELRETLKERIAEVLAEHGLADEGYKRITYLISVDAEHRRRFDELVAELTGQGGGPGGS